MNKLSRQIIVLYNHLIKSYKYTYIVIFIFYVFFCLFRLELFVKPSIIDFILFAYLISIVLSLFRVKKYHLAQKKEIKKDNSTALFLLIFFAMLFEGFFLGYYDNQYQTSSTFLVSTTLQDAEQVENYLNDNNYDVFRHKSNNFYVIGIPNLANSKRRLLAIQLAEKNLINHNVAVQFNNQKSIEENVTDLIYCFYHDLNNSEVKVHFSTINSVKNVTVNIKTFNTIDFKKMDKTITSILIAYIDNLKEENIRYLVETKGE